MNKRIYVLLILFQVSFLFSQNKEKVKGSKIVTKEFTPLTSLINLEIEDNLTVTLLKGTTNSVEIESDDNLHEFIIVESFGSKVRLFTTKNISTFKRLEVIVTYNDSLQAITARHQTTLKAYSELNCKDLTISTFDYSESFLNVKAKNFKLFVNDKAKVELNAKATEISIQTKNNSSLKALVTSDELGLSVIDKSKAVIEGDVSHSNIRTAGSATLMAKNIVSKETEITSENNAISSVYASKIFTLNAKNRAEIHLYGEPKIIIDEFKDKASLLKEDK